MIAHVGRERLVLGMVRGNDRAVPHYSLAGTFRTAAVEESDFVFITALASFHVFRPVLMSTARTVGVFFFFSYLVDKPFAIRKGQAAGIYIPSCTVE